MGLDPLELGDAQISKIADPAEKRRLGKAGLTTEERTVERDMRDEKKLRGEVVGFCERNGIIVDATDPSRRSGLPIGRPDLLLTKNCRCLYLELKTGYNKLSVDQEAYIEKLRMAGNRVYEVRDYPTATRIISDFFNLLNQSTK